jgi:pimeloyl-ACP methyl ester carboxylesterase
MQGGQRVGRLLPDYMHREAWDVLPALLAALGVQRPVLVGHSDGASITLLHASRFAVTACVVMAPHVIVEDVSVRAITEVRAAFEAGSGPGGLRERLSRHHADVDCAFWQWNDVWLSDPFRSFDIRPECERITAPLLAIQGVDDPYGTMLQIDALAAASPGPGGSLSRQNGQNPLSDMHRQLQKLELCGHSPHRDQAALTTRLISDFLRDRA